MVDGPEERQLTVADVPGLIEGAADGAGLGHQFLAHLERARLLVHVLDASEPDLEERFRTIDRELAEYGAGLDERPQLVVLNKIDLVGASLRRSSSTTSASCASSPTSCATGAGIDELKLALFELCPAEPPLPASTRRCRSSSTTGRAPDAGRASGSCAPTAATASSARRRPPEELEAALRGLGIKRGTQVEVGDEELEWQ